jgi:hypothetical protein
MSLRLTRPGPAIVAGAVVAALVVGGMLVVLRPGKSQHSALPAVVDLSAGAVRRLVVEAGGRQAELVRHTGSWAPGPGTTPQSAPLLQSGEDRLFPMRAYRVLRADPADPQYGLAEPSVVVRVEDRAGRQVGLSLGAATFTGAGFYATLDGDPGRLYLVPRSTLDLLRALTTGERGATADPLRDRAGQYEAEQEKAGLDKEVSIYLRQVIDAGGQMPPPAP